MSAARTSTSLHHVTKWELSDQCGRLMTLGRAGEVHDRLTSSAHLLVPVDRDPAGATTHRRPILEVAGRH